MKLNFIFPVCYLLYQIDRKKTKIIRWNLPTVLPVKRRVLLKFMSCCPSTLLGSMTSVGQTSWYQQFWFISGGSKFDAEVCPVPLKSVQRFHWLLEDHIRTVRTQAKDHFFFQHQGELQDALRYFQPVTGCSAEGWYAFLHTVLVFDTPHISRGSDYLKCISVDEYKWNGWNVRILNWAFPAGILWAGQLLMSNWYSWKQFLLLVTLLSVIE